MPVGRGELLFPAGQRGVERLGFHARSWALMTKTVIMVVQMGYASATFDPHLWVYDKATGEMRAEIPLPANATGSPITYMTGGRQYVVFPVGGGPLVEELIAIGL